MSSHLIDQTDLLDLNIMDVRVKALFKLPSLIGDPGEARHMICRSIVGESLHLDSGVQAKKGGYPDPRSTHTKGKHSSPASQDTSLAGYLLRRFMAFYF